MKTIGFAVALSILCSCGTPVSPSEDEGGKTETPEQKPEDKPQEPSYNAFAFIQMSDPQLGFISGETLNFTADSLLLEEMVAQVNRLRPAFVLMTGDMTNTSMQKNQIACYKMIMAKMDTTIRVYTIPGNHDIGGDYSTSRVETFISNYGGDKFSFRHEGCSFIGINSPIIKNSNTELEDQQYAWLYQELLAASDCRLRFIVSHYPFFLASYLEAEDSKNLSQASRDKYWPLFKRQKVSCVMAGHLHYTSFATYNGIKMITMGAVGKPLGSSFSGAALWKVDEKGNYTYDYLSVDDFKNLKTL